MAGGSIWICLLRISQGSLGHLLPFANHAPCWEGFSFGKPAHGHPVWTDCTADPLRLLSRPGCYLPHRTADGFSCLRLCLRLIQPQRLTRVSRQRPRIRSRRDKEPSDPGEPGHVAIIMDPPHRCLISHTPPNRLRDVLVERLDLNSGGLLTGTRWPSFRTTVVGVGKKTWTFTWEAYFRLNYRQEPASKWPELKAKFFNFLIDHHSEWKSIRNNDPLGYLQYMEVQFERVTGYRLVGLGACTEWIRAGTYYHWVIAQQGQLGRCPRLAGIPPPEGPMTPPPYPPVTAAAPPVPAALPVTAAPPVTAALPVTAVASTQATVPNPPQGGGGRP